MLISRLLGALSTCLLILNLLSTAANAAAVSGQGTWETTLQARDFDGDGSTVEGWYDTVLNITWLADANANGGMTWSDAMTWVAGLDFGAGMDNWRLPSINPQSGSSYNTTFSYAGTTDTGYNIGAPGTLYDGSTLSEMGHMYYITLGNIAQYDTAGYVQSGWGPYNMGPFENIIPSYYWSEDIYTGLNGFAWAFRFYNGYQDGYSAGTPVTYAWAVHNGDIGASTVPVPAAVWLFGSGLVGLLGTARRKSKV